MMIRRFVFVILLFIGLFQSATAQDIHFSYFQFSPMTLNPALAGSYEGTFRVGGIYRDQGFAINGGQSYKTPSVYVDAPMVRGIRKIDWIGFGLGFYGDQAGPGSLRTTKTNATISYHFPLDKKMKNVLAAGIQTGTTQRRFANTSALYFEDQIFSGGTSVDAQNLSDTENNTTYTDYAFGLTLTNKLDKVSSLRTGISMNHLNRGDQSIFMNGNERLPWRWSLFGQYERMINKSLTIKPSLIYQQFSNNQELALNTIMGVRLSEESDIVLNGGLGFRVNFFDPVDALQLFLGADIGDLRVGLAYDATLSGMSGINNSIGALEIGVGYIVKIFKRPNVDPVIFCPRF